MEYNTIDVSGIAESLRTLKTITPIKRNKYLDDLAVQVAPLDNNDLETLFKNLPLGPMTASKLRIKIQRVKDSIASGKPIESDKLSLVKKLEEAQLIVQADKRKSAKAQAEAARLAKEAAAAKAAEAAAEVRAAEEARIAAEKLAQEAEAKAAEEAETAGEATQLKALIVKAQDLKKSLDYVPPSLDKQFKEATDPSKSVEQSLVSIAKFISSATKSLRKESVQAVDALRVSSDYNDSYLEEIMDGYCDKDTKYKFFIAVLDESCAEDSDHYICEPENNIIGTFNALYQDCDTQ